MRYAGKDLGGIHMAADATTAWSIVGILGSLCALLMGRELKTKDAIWKKVDSNKKEHDDAGGWSITRNQVCG